MIPQGIKYVALPVVAVPCNEDSRDYCAGCLGHGNPAVCNALPECYDATGDNFIWTAKGN